MRLSSIKKLKFFAAAIGTLSLIPLTVGFAFACFNHANTKSKPRYLIMPTYTSQADNLLALGIYPDYYPVQIGALKNAPFPYLNPASAEFEKSIYDKPAFATALGNKLKTLESQISQFNNSWFSFSGNQYGEGVSEEHWLRHNGKVVFYDRYLFDNSHYEPLVAKRLSPSNGTGPITDVNTSFPLDFKASRDLFFVLDEKTIKTFLDPNNNDPLAASLRAGLTYQDEAKGKLYPLYNYSYFAKRINQDYFNSENFNGIDFANSNFAKRVLKGNDIPLFYPEKNWQQANSLNSLLYQQIRDLLLISPIKQAGLTKLNYNPLPPNATNITFNLLSNNFELNSNNQQQVGLRFDVQNANGLTIEVELVANNKTILSNQATVKNNQVTVSFNKNKLTNTTYNINKIIVYNNTNPNGSIVKISTDLAAKTISLNSQANISSQLHHHPVYEQNLRKDGGTQIYLGTMRDFSFYLYDLAYNLTKYAHTNQAEIDFANDKARLNLMKNALSNANLIVGNYIERLTAMRQFFQAVGVVDKNYNPDLKQFDNTNSLSLGLLTLSQGTDTTTLQTQSKYGFLYYDLGFKAPKPKLRSNNYQELLDQIDGGSTDGCHMHADGQLHCPNLPQEDLEAKKNFTGSLLNMDDNGWWWNLGTGIRVANFAKFADQFDLIMQIEYKGNDKLLSNEAQTAIRTLYKNKYNLTNPNNSLDQHLYRDNYELWNDGVKSPIGLNQVLDSVLAMVVKYVGENKKQEFKTLYDKANYWGDYWAKYTTNDQNN